MSTAPTMPPRPPPPKGSAPAQTFSFSLSKAPKSNAQRIVIYGTGGIGKSTLACSAPGPVGVIDFDGSLGVLGLQHAQVVNGIDSWPSLRAAVASQELWSGIKTMIIDTATRAEAMCAAHVIATVPHEKEGRKIERIEDYGFGKGLQHIHDMFAPLLGDLDAHARSGRNVILVCHECVSNVPNPTGEDWQRYEPRLQSPPSGKGSIRHLVKEWADQVLFVHYDVAIGQDGKAKGSGTRSIQPVERPWCMAKSRTIDTPIPYPKNSDALWKALGL
jgi:hypothetical protein